MSTSREVLTRQGTLTLTRFCGPKGGDRWRLQLSYCSNYSDATVLNRADAEQLVRALQSLLGEDNEPNGALEAALLHSRGLCLDDPVDFSEHKDQLRAALKIEFDRLLEQLR